MDYAAASYDSSQSKSPPLVPEPVYHFQHIAAFKDNELAKRRRKALDAMQRRR